MKNGSSKCIAISPLVSHGVPTKPTAEPDRITWGAALDPGRLSACRDVELPEWPVQMSGVVRRPREAVKIARVALGMLSVLYAAVRAGYGTCSCFRLSYRPFDRGRRAGIRLRQPPF